MIYLFNSAFMPTYLENLYRIMGLPEKAFITIRYSEENNAPEKWFDKDVLTKECIICYIDRFDNYKYIPIRRGIIRKSFRSDGRLYFHIELKGYCYCPDENLELFTNTLKDSCTKFPRLTHTAENENDGIYAHQTDLGVNFITDTGSAWENNVDRLYRTHAFSEMTPPFYKIRIEKEYEPNFNIRGINIKPYKDYIIVMSYKYPTDKVGSFDARIKIGIPNFDDQEKKVGSIADQVELPIHVSPLDFTNNRINISSSVSQNLKAGSQIEVRSYTAEIPIRISTFYPFGTLLVLIFFFSYLSEAFAASTIFNMEVLISSTLEFFKFAIIVYAVYRFKGKMKLSGL